MTDMKHAVTSAMNEILEGKTEPTVDPGTIRIAQVLQVRRENWKHVLDMLPGEKTQGTDFPYASMDAAVADGFSLLFGGKDEAFRLLVKGYKTRAWRKQAEKNRTKRDDLAEGDI